MDSSALLVLLIPAAGVLLARAVCAWWGAGPATRDTVTTIVLGVAIPAALFAAGVRPHFPLRDVDDGWQWLVWLVPAGALLGLVEASRFPAWARSVAVALGGFGAVALLWSPLPARAPAVAGGFGMVLLWQAIARPKGESRRRAIAVSVAIACVAAPPILWRGAHSIALSSFSSVVGAGLAATVLSPRWIAPFPRAAAGVAALGLGGVLCAAHAYQQVGSYDGFPWPAAVALGAAAAAGAVVPARWGAVRAGVVAAGAAIVLAAVSAWTSGAFEPYEVWW